MRSHSAEAASIVSHPRGPVPIALASGTHPRSALHSAIDLIEPSTRWENTTAPILVLTGGHGGDRWSTTALSVLQDAAPAASIAIHRVPGPLATIRRSVVSARGGWIDHALPQGAEHFTRVSIPADIAGAALYLAIDTAGHASALETLAAYTRPRQAVAARLDRRRLGLAAELAAPLMPRLILLHALLGRRHLVAATADRVAAELVYLALRQDGADDDTHRIGPWEDRLVQRATELDLGVHLPSELAIVVASDDASTGMGGEELVLARDRLRAQLGVT